MSKEWDHVDAMMLRIRLETMMDDSPFYWETMSDETRIGFNSIDHSIMLLERIRKEHADLGRVNIIDFLNMVKENMDKILKVLEKYEKVEK